MPIDRFIKAALLAALFAGLAACGGGSSTSEGTGGNPPPAPPDPPPAMPASVTVNWTSTEQTIDGFGAAAADFTSALPNNLADFFFTTSSGIGLSILRTQIMPDLADCQAWVVSLGAPASDCVTVASGATSLVGEPLVAQQAVARGVTTVFSTCWSPPASTKSNGVFYQGGTFIGNATNYTSYAVALASYPAFMAGYGVTIHAISPQNEPDISQTYPSALWTGQQFHDFVPYLHSALQSAGAGSVQIMIPEDSSWSMSYDGFAAPTMTDASVAPDVGIMAQHGYLGDTDIVVPTNYGTHLWMTEDSSKSATYDGSMADALSWAQIIHEYMTVANANAFVWWFLTDMPGNGDGTDNAALTDINGNIPLRAYVTGNWSKFVRPGWHRVSVTYSGSLLISAFANSGNTQGAIVVVNAGSSAVSEVTFLVGTTMGTSIVPWVTSSTQDLQSQPMVNASSGSFAYTIPAESVVTFASASDQ